MCGRVVPFTTEELEDAAEQIRAQGAGGGITALAELLDARDGARDGALDDTRDGRRLPPDARPGSAVPVLLVSDGRLAIVEKVWGYLAPWGTHGDATGDVAGRAGTRPATRGHLIFNMRIERALDALTAGGGGMWADSLARRRCLVPVRMFYETRRAGARNGGGEGRRPPAAARHVAFALPGGGALFLAGVYQDERFSIATTAPNADVAPVHDRMPVALAPREANAWLGPGFGRLADRSALKLVAHPEPDHLGRVARGHNGG